MMTEKDVERISFDPNCTSFLNFKKELKKRGLSEEEIDEHVKKSSIVPLEDVKKILKEIESYLDYQFILLSKLQGETREKITVLELSDITNTVIMEFSSKQTKNLKEIFPFVAKKFLELQTLRNKYFQIQKINSLQNTLSTLKKIHEPQKPEEHDGFFKSIMQRAGDLNVGSIPGAPLFREVDLLKRLEVVGDLQDIYDQWLKKMNSMDLTDEYVELVKKIRKNFKQDRYHDVSEGLENLRWAFPTNTEIIKFNEEIKNRLRQTFR